jgi:uncharacterized protein (DUF1330 family)
MPAYVIADVQVRDQEGFQEYHDGVPGVIAAHGGRYVVRGGRTETLEGDWSPTRVVILEFEDLEQARAWYESAEYQRLRQSRERAAVVSLVLVPGYEGS